MSGDTAAARCRCARPANLLRPAGRSKHRFEHPSKPLAAGRPALREVDCDAKVIDRGLAVTVCEMESSALSIDVGHARREAHRTVEACRRLRGPLQIIQQCTPS